MLINDFDRQIGIADGLPLPISVGHAVTAGNLDLSHRDPFDRLLAVQPLIARVPIVSIDTVFDRFGVERVW